MSRKNGPVDEDFEDEYKVLQPVRSRAELERCLLVATTAIFSTIRVLTNVQPMTAVEQRGWRDYLSRTLDDIGVPPNE